MFYKELLCNATVLLLCSKNLEILQGINHFKALYIVGRGALTPLPFYEDAPILPNPPFSNFVWSLTCNLVFCWYSDLISHTHTHTYIDTHTHTHTHTHTYSEKDNTGKGYFVWKYVIPPFLKQPNNPTLLSTPPPFLWEKSEPHLFFKNFKISYIISFKISYQKLTSMFFY